MYECYIASLNAISTSTFMVAIAIWLMLGTTILRNKLRARKERKHLTELLEAEKAELERLRTNQ